MVLHIVIESFGFISLGDCSVLYSSPVCAPICISEKKVSQSIGRNLSVRKEVEIQHIFNPGILLETAFQFLKKKYCWIFALVCVELILEATLGTLFLIHPVADSNVNHLILSRSFMTVF